MMKRFFRYVALSLAFVSILVAFARPARADAASQALFSDGKKLMEAGKYEEACPKFEESQRLAPGIGTQFNLAVCYESLGRIASAWSLYLDVAALAKSTNQGEREKAARQAAAAIEGKLSRLTITADAKAPANLEVKRDGVVVGRAQFGTAIPVDPGPHKVTATAPGKKLWETTVTVEKGPSTKEVTVPELEAGPPPPPPPPGGGVTSGGVPLAYYSNDPNLGPPRPRLRRRSTGLFALGIVGQIGGTITALISLGYLADRDARGAGAALAILGLGVTGGGIALTVYGASKVPVEPRAKANVLVPEVRVAPTSASLRWTF